MTIDLEILDETTAPETTSDKLADIKDAYGFIPNLYGELAHSESALDAYTGLDEAFTNSDFSPTEQHIILLTTSFENGCDYCMAAHSMTAEMNQVDPDVIEALRNGEEIGDSRLEALHRFTSRIVETRGRVDPEEVQAFMDAGYERHQVLEVLVGVTMKTLSNYTNHIAETPVDEKFSTKAWDVNGEAAAE